MTNNQPQKPRILLFNPPGDEVYIRDYYCSKVSKTDYLYHPTDLLYISGRLKENFTVDVIDAIAERFDETRCLQLIKEKDYLAIVFLTGAVSWMNDRVFLKKVKEETKSLLIGSGDIFMDPTGQILKEYPFLDAIILDFFDPSVASFLAGQRQGLTNIFYRNGNNEIVGNCERRTGYFEVPMPLFHLFPNRKYKYPFARKRAFATVLTDYGCPYKCRFCIMNTLGFRQRTVDNVIEELRAYRNAGVREIYFTDQTFGASKKRLFEVCHKMIALKLKLNWLCFSRVDLIDAETLSLMKKAGCHTILFGVETATQEILDRYRKGITLNQIEKAFQLCQAMGIRTVGTFILGLPGETEKSCQDTIKFALRLKCDYASFNVPVPRVGTSFRAEAIQQGWTSEKLEPMCQAYTYPVLGTDSLPREKIWRLRNKAISEFYLRPSYILRHFFRIRNYFQLETHLRGFYFMIRGMFK
ncbi:B12-binding domain-containing radical SAM protein [candidate division CSSED10-310 bacterium]|uniref:B12-binding domain-containing radical SAM protein n=1 Tax=candidate division CSSED10-310 bacterium TaxID=2855610 RepID=A0ABV6Z6C9_UNCC1